MWWGTNANAQTQTNIKEHIKNTPTYIYSYTCIFIEKEREGTDK